MIGHAQEIDDKRKRTSRYMPEMPSWLICKSGFIQIAKRKTMTHEKFSADFGSDNDELI
jgi:hypothetical protein